MRFGCSFIQQQQKTGFTVQVFQNDAVIVFVQNVKIVFFFFFLNDITNYWPGMRYI